MTNSHNLPKSSQLIEVSLQVLKDLGGSGTSKDIDLRAIALLGLSAEQVALKHSDGSTNRTEIQYRLAWARTLAKRKGLIASSRRSVWFVVQK
jgi:restriction system protein